MSTRSLIACKNEDGSIDLIYCHSDGYPSHNGRILLENYQSPAKVRQLIALGDIYSLGEEIGRRHPIDWREKAYKRGMKYYLNALQSGPYAKMCDAFGRDGRQKATE